MNTHHCRRTRSVYLNQNKRKTQQISSVSYYLFLFADNYCDALESRTGSIMVEKTCDKNLLEQVSRRIADPKDFFSSERHIIPKYDDDIQFVMTSG